MQRLAQGGCYTIPPSYSLPIKRWRSCMGGGFLLVIVVIVGIYLLSSIKILTEYERGVIFRLGHLLDEPKGPGVILVFAPIDRIVRVSLRQEALEVPPQDII